MNRVLLFACLFLLQSAELMAAPGGKIVKELFDTPLGKVIGVILFVVLFPLIAYSWYRTNKAVRATRKQLAKLSNINFELFDEINLKNRMTDVFTRVHKAWSERDLDDCEDYMTHWYRQNQQSVFLDEWDSKGLMNVCTIKEIKSIKPLHLRLTDDPSFEGSRVMYTIEANMEDYLVSIDNSSIMEGKRGFKDVESIWTLKLVDGVWRVDNIEQDSELANYLKMDAEWTDAIIARLLERRA